MYIAKEVKAPMKKTRKGSLLAILLFAVIIAIMSFGTVSVATTLYASNNESTRRYSHIQSYRAATEIAAYQYISDLQAVNVTKNLNADWISVSGGAVYTQALELIVNEIGTVDEPLTWKTLDIIHALSGAPVQNPEVLTNLLGLLGQGRAEFKLSIVDYPEIEWNAGESYVSRDESQLKLRPIEIVVELIAKGEVLKEHLFVSGLHLDVLQMKVGRDTLVTMNITTGEKGVQIYRE